MSETGFREEAEERLKEFDMDKIVKQYGGGLFRYVYTLVCDYQEAEDVVQDVFISAYQARARFDGKNLSGWLYRIAYNKSLDSIRRKKPLSLHELSEEALASEDSYDIGYDPTIITALKELSEEDRFILLGRITESLKYAEIADRLGMSEPTVRKRYERAKKKVAEQLYQTEREDIQYEF